MRYKFNNFEFDTENLLLTHNGEAITIRHTEAKVLAVFLQNQDKRSYQKQIALIVN